MAKSNSDQSINNEPHFQRDSFEADPGESIANEQLENEKKRELIHDQVGNAVWDEPALSMQLVENGVPEDAVTYKKWLTEQNDKTSFLKSWWVVIIVALAAGPWSIIGTFLQGSDNLLGLVMVTLIGPATEETMKIAIPLWIVERRPFLFRSRFQIGICVVAGGVVFAVIENLIYIHIYFPWIFKIEPTVALIDWRWTVCVALHTVCAFISGLGIMRIWAKTMKNHTPPDMFLIPAYLFSAIFVHGLYNFTAVLELFPVD